MWAKQKGFTIVELLIVIVVIAILAAISIVAYNGIQDRAQNTARYNELFAWRKQFQLYAAQYGSFPSQSSGSYCLGEGFPDTSGDGVGDCRDTQATATRHSVNATLNAELAKVGTLPSGPRNSPGNAALGPFVTYFSTTSIDINTMFKASTCPEGTAHKYTYAGNAVVWCGVSAISN